MESSKAKDYTVIGYYPETMQRFMFHIIAESGDHAEKIVIENYKETGVAVVGSIEGFHKAADAEPYVQVTE